MKKSSPIILLLSVLLAACNVSYQPKSVEYVDYRIGKQPAIDSSVYNLLTPYRSKLQSTMDEVLVTIGTRLERKQPEGTLGNLMADVMLKSVRQKFNRHVDIAFVNNGGIRVDQIPAGPLTRGKLFELAPFDNYVVLMEVSGARLKQFLDHISVRGGWPVSGMRMQISDKKAKNIVIGDKPLDENGKYVMAIVDYVANGGDDASMLTEVPKIDSRLLLRSMLEEYFIEMRNQGKIITASIEGRVTTN